MVRAAFRIPVRVSVGPAGLNAAHFQSRSQLVAFSSLLIVLMSCFLLGGSARDDVASLMVLRPLLAAAVTIGTLCLTRCDVRNNRFILIFCAMVVVLPLVHLLPLPPEFWSRLPGRAVVAKIDAAADLGPQWRPLSLAPAATWNAFYASLVVPAVIVPGIHLREVHRQMLLPVLLALGTSSVLLGLLQAAGTPDSSLYLYRVTNNGAQVGLFANRNHQALLVAMMLPMLGVLSAQFIRGKPGERVLGLALVGWSVALLPVLLLIGSRGGLLVGILALAALPLLVGSGASRQARSVATASQVLRHRILLAGGVTFVIVCGIVVGLTVLWGQGVALDRLMSRAIGEDLRWRMIPAIVGMIVQYWPFGSGVGSFEKAFKISEPDSLLGPEYVNHAHNDWLELLATAGLFGLIMLVIAAFGLFVHARRAWATAGPPGSTGHLLRLGYVLIGLAALGSLGDYPLRTPALAALFAVAVLWAGCPLELTRPMSQLEKS